MLIRDREIHPERDYSAPHLLPMPSIRLEEALTMCRYVLDDCILLELFKHLILSTSTRQATLEGSRISVINRTLMSKSPRLFLSPQHKNPIY